MQSDKAAAAVASHECGHAVQHAEAYGALQMRSAIVPIVNIASQIQGYLFSFAVMMFAGLNNDFILLLAIGTFLVTTFFSLITLPVEFDASNRALAWLDSSNITYGREYDGAKDALWWAAMTYVAAALAVLSQLIYLIIIFLNNRRN